MSVTDKITKYSVQAAFIAVSSRVVGSLFRFLETLNPNIQKTQVISDPKTVFIREFSTISMAWVFALITNIVIKPIAEKKGLGSFGVQFATTVIGTTMAEAIGRFVAYRKTLQRNKLLDNQLRFLPSDSLNSVGINSFNKAPSGNTSHLNLRRLMPFPAIYSNTSRVSVF